METHDCFDWLAQSFKGIVSFKKKKKSKKTVNYMELTPKGNNKIKLHRANPQHTCPGLIEYTKSHAG